MKQVVMDYLALVHEVESLLHLNMLTPVRAAQLIEALSIALITKL